MVGVGVWRQTSDCIPGAGLRPGHPFPLREGEGEGEGEAPGDLLLYDYRTGSIGLQYRRVVHLYGWNLFFSRGVNLGGAQPAGAAC